MSSHPQQLQQPRFAFRSDEQAFLMQHLVDRNHQTQKKALKTVALCDRKLDALQKQMDKLKQEKWENELIASLDELGAEAWRKLSDAIKWNKSVVLATLQCKEASKVPSELRGGFAYLAPPELWNDRDVLIARLAQPDFCNSYKYYQLYHDSDERKTPFTIPENLVQDKEFVAAVVSRYPEVLLHADNFPPELWDHCGIFRAFVQSERWIKNLAPSLPSHRLKMETLLGKFSLRVRGNAHRMLEAGKHVHSIFCHLPESLACNASFVKTLVGIVPNPPSNTLVYLSERIRDNFDIVLALVEKNGYCLEFASASLRSNEDIVRAACKNQAGALLYCQDSSPTKERLFGDQSFMMDVFSTIARIDTNLYHMQSDDLQSNWDIVVAAQGAECLCSSDLPLVLVQDRSFWMHSIGQNPSFWPLLPVEFASEESFAFAITNFKDTDLVEEVFSRLPRLANDGTIWGTIVDTSSPDLSLMLRAHSPPSIRSNRELMLGACKADCKVLELLPDYLQEDRELVQAAVDNSNEAFFSLSKSVQRLYPALTAKAIRKVTNELESFGDIASSQNIAQELWTNVDVVGAWIELVGTYESVYGSGDDIHELLSRVPECLKQHETLGIIAATHMHSDVEFFTYCTSEALRSSKPFMLRACRIEGFAWRAACGGLDRDLDVATAAFDGENKKYVLDDILSDEEDTLMFLRTVRRVARERIEAFVGFTEGFIFGMSKFSGPDCSLPMLIQDDDTTLGVKKRIAGFLGVPSVNDLSRFRSAVDNLERLPKAQVCECQSCGLARPLGESLQQAYML